MKLTSVYIANLAILEPEFIELTSPLLRFGRGKKNERRLPVCFALEHADKCHELYEELNTLRGQTLDEIVSYLKTNLDKYKPFIYKK